MSIWIWTKLEKGSNDDNTYHRNCYTNYPLTEHQITKRIHIRKVSDRALMQIMKKERKSLNIVIKHVFICSNPYIYITVVQEIMKSNTHQI